MGGSLEVFAYSVVCMLAAIFAPALLYDLLGSLVSCMTDERIRNAMRKKEAGNAALKAQDFERARKKYNSVGSGVAAAVVGLGVEWGRSRGRFLGLVCGGLYNSQSTFGATNLNMLCKVIGKCRSKDTKIDTLPVPVTPESGLGHGK